MINRLFLLLIGILVIGCNSVYSQITSFKHLTIDYYESHEGSSRDVYEIYNDNDKLYLVKKEYSYVDSTKIEYYKYKHILDFINFSISQEDSCTGSYIAGGDSELKLNIDGKKVKLTDCLSHEIDVQKLVKFLKKSEGRLSEDSFNYFNQKSK